MTTLTDLERLARAATPGPWVQQPDGWTVRRVVAQDASQRGWRVAYTYASGPDRVEQEVADAAYIADCFPERVLAMIAVIEAAKFARIHLMGYSAFDKFDAAIEALEQQK